MQICAYTFDKVEFARSLVDLGTLVPFSMAFIVIAELRVSALTGY
jgi:hypothetical protein